MPRRAGPWYRASRQMWYATVGGVQIALEVRGEQNRAAAVENLKLLLEAAQASNPAHSSQLVATHPNSPTRTISQAVAEFLARRKPKLSPECYRQYRITLTIHLAPAFGSRPLGSLIADELEAWADRPAWSNSTRNNNLGTVQTFLKWAGCPLSLRRPPKESRGADAILTDAEFETVLAAAVRGRYKGDLRELLRCLRETGARPQEIARLTAESVDWSNTCARLRQHKTRHHGIERVIHFNAAAMAVLTAQRERYGAGHLFRTRAGNAYSGAAIVKRMLKVSARCGIHATAYGLGRHSFATAALAAGVPDALVAELLGHRGTGMLAKHYSHLNQRSRELKAAVEKVSKPKAG